MVRAVALVFGVSFLAVGVLGFILNPTGGELLGIFAVHVLHNLVHLLFGIFGIAAVLAANFAEQSFSEVLMQAAA
jgi:hypothetical protein